MITPSAYCIALRSKGYTPQVLKPVQILAGFIVSIQASLSSLENWHLVTTLLGFFPYIFGKHIPNAFLKDQIQMHPVVMTHEWYAEEHKI